jgi:hypothetical protein
LKTLTNLYVTKLERIDDDSRLYSQQWFPTIETYFCKALRQLQGNTLRHLSAQSLHVDYTTAHAAWHRFVKPTIAPVEPIYIPAFLLQMGEKFESIKDVEAVSNHRREMGWEYDGVG